MVFSSLPFIGIFLPIFFFFYYIVPDRRKNVILLLGSLCFYLVGTLDNPENFFLLLASIGVDFAAGVLMERYPQRKKLLLTVGVVFHLLCLGAFKYSGFLLGEINRLIPGADLVLNTMLPIGISFYTFQGISYIADVYRGKIPAEKSLLRFAVYISMFEQLIAGPIVTYDQVGEHLKHRRISRSDVQTGVGTFIFGLGLKVLLANPLGKLWGQLGAIGYDSISTPLAWMGAVAYSLQIYLDFFGYSLMAVGLGRMLGFRLPKNFDHPYLSRTMTEFWRRWHITLGSWFREYVYIPLGGNRKGSLTTVRNLLIVWLLTGVWHGAGYNFLLWGLVLFVIVMAEKQFLAGVLNRVPVVGHLYMLLLIPLTWMVFEINDLELLGLFYSRLFPVMGQGVWSTFRYDYLKYWGQYYPFFIIGILFCTRLPYKFLSWLKESGKVWCIRILLAAVLAGSIYCMYRGFDDPFLYFRF